MERKRYVYGLRLRPAGMGCQPEGERREMNFRQKGMYWSIVSYPHMLSDDDADHYDMDLLGVKVERD